MQHILAYVSHAILTEHTCTWDVRCCSWSGTAAVGARCTCVRFNFLIIWMEWLVDPLLGCWRGILLFDLQHMHPCRIIAGSTNDDDAVDECMACSRACRLSFDGVHLSPHPQPAVGMGCIVICFSLCCFINLLLSQPQAHLPLAISCDHFSS